MVIGDEPPREPHHLDVASRLPLQPSTGLYPVQVAVDVELEQDRGMIGRPSGRLGHDTVEPSSPRSIASTKASITRTRLSSSIQSSRHSGTASSDCDLTLQQNAPPAFPATVEESYHPPRFYTGRLQCRRPARWHRMDIGHGAFSQAWDWPA
jgi:hypothetical protein